jgi:hypothetical protein
MISSKAQTYKIGQTPFKRKTKVLLSQPKTINVDIKLRTSRSRLNIDMTQELVHQVVALMPSLTVVLALLLRTTNQQSSVKE